MKIGDIVTWTSQAAGVRKTKSGPIVAVLSPGEQPRQALDKAGLHTYKIKSPGMCREHESYIVQIGSKVYWPLVKNLRAGSSKAPFAFRHRFIPADEAWMEVTKVLAHYDVESNRDIPSVCFDALDAIIEISKAVVSKDLVTR